ncbi:MAG: DUF998 domain-containing protein [Clostridiales bacterium]|nr:DUF998 domain-containing protein [Clostridiales bacterium]
MSILLKYGWYALLIAIFGDMLIPFIIAPFYKGYRHTEMTISALGNPKSPVRVPFNIWMLIEGILLLLSVPAIYDYYISVSKSFVIIVVAFFVIFAVGACIFTCFFSVNETKDEITTASKIHGFGSVIGFMLFLFVPLLLSILEFKKGNNIVGIISAISFAFSLLFFVLFVMADKPDFKNTIIAKEGLWQRFNLLFMYLPLAVISFRNLFFVN